jgi:hypothetical protein
MITGFTEVTCTVGPGCFHKVAIRIYATIKGFEASFNGSLPQDCDLMAFCSCNKDGQDPIATLHFCLDTIAPDNMAHEAFHAVAELARILKLNLDDDYAQELLAHCITHLMLNIQEAVKIARPSKRPAKRRRRSCDL